MLKNKTTNILMSLNLRKNFNEPKTRDYLFGC